MQPYPRVSGGDSRLVTVTTYAQAFEVHPAEGLGVLRLEGIQQGQNTGAHHGIELLIR